MLNVACDDRLVYFEYGHTPQTGWEKNEPVVLDVAPIADNGTYDIALALRVNDNYPFTKLHLTVQQTIYPSGNNIVDHLTIDVTDNRGNILGKGVSSYQYETMMRKLDLHHGDSLHIEVKHDMKREILPGIMDVGYKVMKD